MWIKAVRPLRFCKDLEMCWSVLFHKAGWFWNRRSEMEALLSMCVQTHLLFDLTEGNLSILQPYIKILVQFLPLAFFPYTRTSQRVSHSRLDLTITTYRPSFLPWHLKLSALPCLTAPLLWAHTWRLWKWNFLPGTGLLSVTTMSKLANLLPEILDTLHC